MSLQTLWREGAQRLREAGCDTPLLDARLLIQHVTGFGYETFLLNAKQGLPPLQQAAFDALMARREQREPMSHLLGVREFYGREFIVTKDVLTPRPDSETLIDVVRRYAPPPRPSPLQGEGEELRILDLGTGSGCLLITLLAELKNASGTGVDASEAALAVARQNAVKTGVDGRAEWILSRWYETLSGRYEIVVANPPYIASNALPGLMPEVARYEPLQALDGGPDGLACYRDIAAGLPRFITDDALVALEVGEGQHTAVAEIFTAAGFAFEAFVQDHAGITRCVVLRSGKFQP